jgi:hypothetical protein
VRKQAGCEQSGFTDGEVLEQPTGLHDRRHQSKADGFAGIHPEDGDFADCWLTQPQDDVDGGGLAGPVGAKESHDLPRVDRQVDPPYRLDWAEALAHSAQADRGAGIAHCPLPAGRRLQFCCCHGPIMSDADPNGPPPWSEPLVGRVWPRFTQTWHQPAILVTTDLSPAR